MFDVNSRSSRADDPDTVELLVELERNVPEAIKAQRSSTRITIKARVEAFAANIRDRQNRGVVGVTGDISEGGCQILFSRPICPGDIVQLVFDRETLDLAPVMARCMRSRLVNDSAFETGFAFFGSLDVSALLPEDTLDGSLI
ncbi:MAG: PilZ domain-containing protein [Planctomycetota bacterium]